MLQCFVAICWKTIYLLQHDSNSICTKT